MPVQVTRHPAIRVVRRMAGEAALRLATDAGAGSILAVAIIAAVLVATTAVLPVTAVLVAHRQASSAADASALAAADAAVGIQPGAPCVLADAVAVENGATVDGCRLDGVVATVTTTVAVATFRLSATATAGPPGMADGSSAGPSSPTGD
ncbi:Rv3654c family TadE-like protein [Marisediminicola senii]|uniref:Rv3654c family TadE-like protein n=1 Tax=Marisediminicola senii TaxID=2711233 RepID=UPI0013E9F452|nr:Rv3654c family TadE-like protein [Marisediminicola senii]